MGRKSRWQIHPDPLCLACVTPRVSRSFLLLWGVFRDICIRPKISLGYDLHHAAQTSRRGEHHARITFPSSKLNTGKFMYRLYSTSFRSIGVRCAQQTRMRLHVRAGTPRSLRGAHSFAVHTSVCCRQRALRRGSCRKNALQIQITVSPRLTGPLPAADSLRRWSERG